MNKEKVEKARDLVANAPDIYMEAWFNDQFECGTVGCIAGWVLLDAKLTKRQEGTGVFGAHGYHTVTDVEQPCVKQALEETGEFDPKKRINSAPSVTAAKLMGLTPAERKRLFHLQYWPEKFYKAYAASKSSEGRKQAVVDRINHFIATDGTE